MPNSTEEYLPSPTNQAPQKAFRLAPVEDDLTSVILSTRMDALCNKRLSKPARLLFSVILEMSVRRSTNVAPGILRISDVKLGDMIGAGRKSISRWKAELLRANLVRFGHYFMPNTWPLTIWYVSALVPKNPHETKTTEAGLWGNGQRRGNNTPQKAMWVKVDPCGSKTPENAQSPEMTPGTGQECPASRVTGDAGQGSLVTPGKGQGCPAPGVTADPPPASRLTRPRRHGRPVPGVTADPHEKAQEGGKADLKGGEAPAALPPPSILEWEKKLVKMYPRELETIKTELLAQVRAADPKDFCLREDINYRLECVETQLFGRPVHRNKPAKATPTVKTAPKELNAAELLQTAREAVAGGFANKLTDAQKNALRQAGEAS